MTTSKPPAGFPTDPSSTELMHVVVAGPSSNVTIPGLMTGEVVGSLSAYANVTLVPINPSKHPGVGLDRAKSLAAAFRPRGISSPTQSSSLHLRDFTKYFEDRVNLAVALAWPSIDNSWISPFVHAARLANVRSAVLVVSLPSSSDPIPALVAQVANADAVFVGDLQEAEALLSSLRIPRPNVNIHPALSLTGRLASDELKRITAFLVKDDHQTLTSVLTAFDALPDAWMGDYELRVMMRQSNGRARDLVERSHHAKYVHLIGDDLSSCDFNQVISSSSALSVADPAFDSRAFAAATAGGVATVVMAQDMVTPVGQGYVGGLLADVNRPTSIYVANNHALRLASLSFPISATWPDLAARLVGAPIEKEVLPVPDSEITRPGLAEIDDTLVPTLSEKTRSLVNR